MNSFKILIIGSNDIWSIERFYLKYLREAGMDVHLFEAQNKFITYYGQSLMNKLLFKTGLSSFYKNLNKELIDYTDRLAPDVIWVFKGMEVLPETLKYFKSKHIFLMNYNPDNPFIFSGKGSGNANVTDAIGLYDLHLTYNLAVKAQIENEYKLPVEILPFGFDIDEDVYEMCAKEPEVLKTCFIGNPDKERVAFINEVAEEIAIDVYGNDWDNAISHKNITTHPPRYGNDCWKILRQYRVQLNLMRVHNLDSHNMRTFEIPGIGGIMLAPATKEHLLYFKEGENAFFFKDAAECIAKIKYVLALPGNAACTIRENARATSLANGYSYKDRAGDVIAVINKYRA